MKREILWNSFDILLAFVFPLWAIWFTGTHCHPAVLAHVVVLIMPVVAIVEDLLARLVMTKEEYAKAMEAEI